MANLYLQGETGWQERPDFEAAGKKPADLVAALLAHPAIAHVILPTRTWGLCFGGKRG